MPSTKTRKTRTTFVEIHQLKTYPTSLVNRDEDGRPKTTVHGGYTRGRVASQSWKRSMRIHFETAELLDPDNLATRTRKISRLIAAELAGRGMDDADAERLAVNLVWGAGLLNTDAANAANQVANVLLFLAQTEVAAMAERLYEQRAELLPVAETIDKVFPADEEGVKKSKGDRKAACPEPFKALGKDLLKRLDAHRAADIALFGRMLAAEPSANVVAAANVAHSFGVSELIQIGDFYTAVDDLVDATAGEAGTGFMGTATFDAPTLYEYACLNIGQLTANLDGDDKLTEQAVRAFLHAAVFAQPSAKSASTAPFTRPSLVMIVIRHDLPLSLANAFLKPITPTPGGRDVEANAARALAAHWKRLADMYGTDPETKTYHAWLGDQDVFDETAPLPGTNEPVATMIDRAAALAVAREGV